MQNVKDCPGYQLAETKFSHMAQNYEDLKRFSDARDEESERSITSMTKRLDNMEIQNEKQHSDLNKKIDKVETNLTNKIDDLDKNISGKIDQVLEQKTGQKAIKAWKWLLGVGTTVGVAILIALLTI